MHGNLSNIPRSILYNLKPIGIGTELVESLTSYLARIAFEHNTTVGHIVNKLLIPTMNKDYLLRSSASGGNRFYEGSRTLNGYMGNSVDVVNAMEKLTCRIDLRELTILNWKNVIPLRGLLKESLYWCPSCIKKWMDNRSTVHYPLVWFLNSIKVCDIHSCLLINTCPSCNRKQDILRRQSIIGLCQHCYQSLGLVDKVELCTYDNLKWHKFVFNSISSLLTYEVKKPLHSDFKLFDNLNLINEKVFDGLVNQFSKKINCAHNTVHGWLKGSFTPILENQINICYQLNIGIEQLLFGTIDVEQIKILNNKNIEVAAIVKSKTQLDNNYIKKQLEEIIHEEEAFSMEAAAKRIGVNKRTLYRNFRELCIQISDQYKQYLEERKCQRILDLKVLIEETFINLYQLGIYPSRRKIELYMNRPGVLKERVLQNHWKNLLSKQGEDFSRGFERKVDIL
jgi:hypothetical protein